MYGGMGSERPVWSAGVGSERKACLVGWGGLRKAYLMSWGGHGRPVLYPTVLTLKPRKLKHFLLSIHFYYFSYALWGLSLKVFSLNFRCRDALYDHEHFSVIGKVGSYL